ncbi:MAG: hypothetical protein KDD11_13130 [Acidobacteria bacterium]|nr:hypothetical protein [Acidobacteriota bacterium]
MTKSAAGDYGAQRDEIVRRLEGGLETNWADRADSHDKIQQIIRRLRQSDGTLESKLVLAGFTLEPVEHGGVEQACETCMYYLVHRRFCELPGLDLPVEPQWSCNLWRI